MARGGSKNGESGAGFTAAAADARLGSSAKLLGYHDLSFDDSDASSSDASGSADETDATATSFPPLAPPLADVAQTRQ